VRCAGRVAVAMNGRDFYGLGNMTQRTELYLRGYQGVDWRLYFHSQAADALCPLASARPHSGAPEAGLTNAQAWAKYGIAVAGAVAPANCVTPPGIVGLADRLP
jgi:hypothetical protein